MTEAAIKLTASNSSVYLIEWRPQSVWGQPPPSSSPPAEQRPQEKAAPAE